MDQARAVRLSSDLKGTDIAGWTIGPLIDWGKSALVFDAQKDATQAAIKLFDPELIDRYGAEVQEERVSRERNLVGKHHPHLVDILDAGKSSDYFFVVMSKVPGTPLSKVLDELPRNRIWPLIGQIAAAAEFLEKEGFVHRDIKPSNIKIATDFSNAVLLDLGVLKPFVGVSVTDLGKKPFIGTLQYASPEFLYREETATPDGWRALTFYQLGAVLHDMIMKKRIFLEFEEPFARLVDAVRYQTPEISAADVPPELVSLARVCLTKHPENRLKFVTWESFQPRSQVRSLTSIKDTVRKNAEAALGVPIEVQDLAQKQRSIRAQTAFIQFELERMVHEETIGNALFPPLSTHQYPSQNVSVATTAFTFAIAAALGLRERLSFVVRTVLIDPGSKLIRLEIAAFLSKDRDQVAPDVTNLEGEVLFAGAYEERLIRDRLGFALYTALSKAQEFRSEITEALHLIEIVDKS